MTMNSKMNNKKYHKECSESNFLKGPFDFVSSSIVRYFSLHFEKKKATLGLYDGEIKNKFKETKL